MANEIEIVVKDRGTSTVTKNIDKLQAAAARLNHTGVRVDVDADTGAAQAQLAAVEGTARRLDGDTARVDVDANTAGADAKLSGTKREVNSLDGRQANVSVDANVNGALAKIALVGVALAGLGAGGLALGALGLGGAAAGGLGIGAMAAGLSGVGDAVKQLGVKTAGAGGSAKKAAGDHLAMASALDRVKQSEQQLTSARLDAADAARSAQMRIADASRSVVSAQQREHDAQQDLTAARKEAAGVLADLVDQTADMALRQRDAAIRVAETKDALTAANKDRHGTDATRGRAQLAYDEAIQNQKEIGKATTELAAQQADATRKGVEGSDQVVAASRRVADAHAAVVDAQRQVEEAQRQAAVSARHSAESIASAQQAVVEAQRGVQRAGMAAAGGSGAAAGGVSKLQQAMDNLSPAGQKFALFLRDLLDGPLRDLKFAVQDGMLPPLQKALEDAIPTIEELTPQIGDLSKAFGEGAGLMIDLATTMAPALLDLAQAGTDGLKPLAPILKEFAENISGVLEELINSGEVSVWMDEFVQILALFLDYAPEFILLAADMADQLGPEMIPLIAELLPLFTQLIRVAGPLLVAAIKITIPILKLLTALLEELPRDTHIALVGIRGFGDSMKWLGHMLGIGVRAVYGFVKDSVRYINSLWDWVDKYGGRVWDGIVQGAQDMYYSALGWLDRLGERAKNLGTTIYDNTIGAIPGFASGGAVGGGGFATAATGGARGNLVMVGEQGREMVRLPFGSTVMPHGGTEAALAAGGRGGATSLELIVTDNELGRFLAEILRKYVRIRGGSVQVVLGK